MSDTPAYSPAALDELKKKIAHMAIAFAMVETEWYGNAERGYRSSGFDFELPAVGGPTGTIRITNTQSSGMGLPQDNVPPPGAVLVSDGYDDFGLYRLVYEVDPWADIYEPWITRINDALEGWEALPDPAHYADPVERIRAAVTALTPLPTGGNGIDPDGDFSDDFASVDLEANLTSLYKWTSSQDGDGANVSAMLYAFDDAYGAGRIRPVLVNQAQVGVVLGVTLLGEQKIWEKAREDIVKLAAEAERAFDPFGGGVEFNIGILKAFAGLLGHFAPPPLKTILAVGGSALSLIETLLPPETESEVELRIDGGTAEQIYQSMCDAITDLSRKIADQELELSTTLGKLLGVMDSGPGSQFHIHPTHGMASDLLNAPVIDTHIDRLRDIGYQTVPMIAAVMGRAAEHAHAADKPTIWERTIGIGLGGSGPYTRWSAVLNEFDAVATGSGAELVEAGRLLAVGAGFLEDVDGNAGQALRGIEDDLARGEYGWDAEDVISPPTGGHHIPV